MPKKKKINKNKDSIHPSSTESPDKYLLHYLKSHSDKVVSKATILKKMLSKYSLEVSELAINILHEQSKIDIIGGNKVKLTTKSSGKNHVEGKIDMTKTGSAFLMSSQLDRDAFISNRNLNTALDGDTVIANIFKKSSRPEAEVIEIVKRNKTQFIGTLQVSDKFAFLACNSEKMPFDIFIPLAKLKGAKDGAKALVNIVRWERDMKNPEGEVLEILGTTTNSDLEMKSILIDKGFSISFPPSVIEESEAISEIISKEEIAKRLDYRAITTFTIDPADAKDFDDALSIQRLPNGNWEVGVHIADVSHYVKQGTSLDKEAFERSTSVYLPDRVCPMFPERLSNFICSLRPDEEKLCFAAIFEFDHQHKIKTYSFGRTVIKSSKRFSYEEAQELIEGKESEFSEDVLMLNTIALSLRKDKIAKGAITFEAAEVRFILDETGKPIDVYTKERKEAHMLIEDFMLLANKSVAMYVSKLKVKTKSVPMVYRIHDVPDMTKLQNFSEMAKRFGHNIKFEDPKNIAFQLNDFFKLIKGKPEQNLLEQLGIRSMAKAIYTTTNIGHFGLAFDYYTHFTSPIRRYPDVMVHRILEECLAEEKPPLSADELEEQCVHCSNMERMAAEAEREATKYKQCEFLMDKIGTEFDGIISGIIANGIFVELKDNKCEGFVPVMKLGYDSFIYDENNFTLKAKSSALTYRFGDALKVIVSKVDLAKKQIEFELAEDVDF